MVSPTSASGLCPVLAHLEGEPGAEFELARADDAGHIDKQGDSFRSRCPAPGLEGVKRGLHCLFCVLCVGLLMNADDLGGARGIYGVDFASVLMRWPPMVRSYSRPSWLATRGQRCLHLARVFRCLEVGKWFIHKPALGRARLNRGGEFCGCHSP